MFLALILLVRSLTICSPLPFCNTTEPTCAWLERDLTWRYPHAPAPDVEEATSEAFAFWERETGAFRFFKNSSAADVEFFLIDDSLASHAKNGRVFLNLRGRDAYTTIVHQIGHVLGLPDNERDVDSVMFGKRERKRTKNDSLGSVDLDALNEIYDGVCSRTYDTVTMTNRCLLVGIKGGSYRSYDACENEVSSEGKLSDLIAGHELVRSAFLVGNEIAVISPWDLLYLPGGKVLDLTDFFQSRQRVTVGLEIAGSVLLFFTEGRTVWIFSKTDYFRRNVRIEDLFDRVPFYDIVGAYVTNSSDVSLITENYERWVYRDYKLVERKDFVLEYPSLFCENVCTPRRVFATASRSSKTRYWILLVAFRLFEFYKKYTVK